MKSDNSTTRRSVLAASASGALAFSLAGCFGGDGDDEEEHGSAGEIDPENIERGGEFSIGVPNEIETSNPLTASTAQTLDLLGLVYQTGTVVDPENFETRPWAFTDWDATESEGGMEIYVSINTDLEWTDGESFTTEDAIFTYEYYLDQQPGRFLTTVEPIESVSEANNEFDVEISLSEVIGAWESDLLGLPLLPEHLWSEIENYTEYEGDPVGLAGEITSYDPGAVEISFDQETPFSRYDWIEDHDQLIAQGPFLDSIRFEVFGSESSLQRAFLDGEIDAIYEDAFDPNQAEAIESHEDLGLVSGHADGYHSVTLNTRNAPFDDQAFRQALRMALDETRWVEEFSRGYAVPGSFVVVPAYEGLRPESAADEEIQRSPDDEPASPTQALWYRGTEDGDLDVEGIREFLESGDVIDGSEGSYAGFEYPGSLTDVEGTAQNEANYEYEFDGVQSEILEESDGDSELYVDGQTIEELLDGPITVLNYPEESRPRVVEFTRSYISDLHQLGIPVEEEVVTASVMADRVYLDADFGIHPMSWSATSPQGVSTLYNLFHSNNAHGDESDGSFASNASGYGLGESGLDEEIDEIRAELDEERRNALVQEAAERLYLESPTLVAGYGPAEWPVRNEGYNGFVSDITGVGSSNLWLQCLNVHQE
jgi:peptide/nickel transport system substrate-binding protein